MEKRIKKIFLLSSLLFLIISGLFVLYTKHGQALPPCDCNVDEDCPNFCPFPQTPSGLTWLVVSDPETMLGPTWGVSQFPDYFQLTGSVNINTTQPYYYHTGLNPGTYYSYQVRGCNTNCQICGTGECAGEDYVGLCEASSDVCGNYSASWGRYTEFYAPTSLSVYCYLSGSEARANLSWTDNSGAESGYKIEMRYSNEGSYYEIGSAGANATSYTVTNLSQGREVYFRVRAYHNSGSYSGYSNESSCVTPLAAPSNLVATPHSTDCGRVDISWQDNSVGEDGFKIERKTWSGGTWSEIATVGANVTSYMDTGLCNGYNYYYRVRAYRGSVYSNYSNESDRATTCLPAPSNLSCTPGSRQISLSWQDNSYCESGFSIERVTGTSCSGFSQIDTVPANTTSYLNTNLDDGTSYCYRVGAYTPALTSYSNNTLCTTILPAPSNLSATAVSPSQINLSWTDNSTGESGFKIYRATGSCSNFGYLTAVGANVTSFSNTGLEQGTTYCYYVTAYTSYTESNPSNQASATTFLPAPSNLSATAVSPSQINLSWTDNSTGESGFKIERGNYTCSGFLQISTAPANSTTFSNTGLDQCTAYCYRVRAYTNYTDSPYSNNAVGTTTLPIPSNLTATPDSTTINLSWADNSNNESGFKIRSEEGNNCGASSPVVGTVGQNVTSFQHSGLKNGWQYCYSVCAYSDYCGEGCSSSVTAITSLPAPSNLSFSSVGTNGFVLTWADNSNSESGFKIEEKVGSSGSWTEVGTVNANTTTFTRSGLSCSGSSSNQYYYRVRAYTSYANSSYSNEIGPKSPLPCPASNLSANVVGPNQVNLSWSDNSSNESGFKIERKTGSTGSYQVIDIVNANVTSYSDTTAQDGTNYYYRVRAYNSDGDSDASNEVSATTPLPAPSNLQCNAVSSSQINLSWSDNSLNEASFKIERKVSGGNYSEIATVGQNTTNYANVNLPENTTYYYRVKAANSNTESNYSNEVYCTTLIYVPTGYLISSIFDTGVSQGVAFNSLVWYGTLPATAHVRFQFASSNCQNGADNPPSCDINTGWEDNFKGPDGTSATYYEPAGPAISIPLKTFYHNNHRYFRYKVFLYPNEDRTQTPVIQRVIINYSP